jgi:hypothetical protein
MASPSTCDNRKVGIAVDGLRANRTVGRFGLTLWTWRHQPNAWRESFDHFSAHFPALRQIALVTTSALEAANQERTPWSDWILNELQEGEAHVIPTTDAILDTFVALALRRVDPDSPAPNLPPAEWMVAYGDYWRNVVAAAAEDPRNSDLADVSARARLVTEALQQGAAAWSAEERQRTVAEPLVASKVAAFRERALAALAESRSLPDLLRLASVVTPLPATPDNPPLIESSTHKGIFTADGRMLGADMIAVDLGRNTAHFELRQLFAPMSDVPRTGIVAETTSEPVDDQFAEQLRQLAVRMASGPQARYVVLFLPIQWRLSQALGLAFLGHGADAPQEWSLSKGTADDFAGFFAGIPAFQLPEVPDGVLYVVDLGRYVRAESWVLTPLEQLAIRTLTEEEALERARRTTGHEELGVAETALRWREHVFFYVDTGLRLREERDESAVTAVEIPSTLG